MAQKTIYCFGGINLDILVHPVDKWPTPGGLVQAEHVIFTPGGTAFNTALAIKKLGKNAVELMGCIGMDDAGDKILSSVAGKGLGMGGLIRTETVNSGVCIVAIQSSGERSFIYSAGANDAVTSFSSYLDKIEAASMVHLGGVLDMVILSGAALEQIVNDLRKKNCFISFDLAWDWQLYGWESLQAGLKHTDIVSLNEQEAMNLTGDSDLVANADKLYSAGCPFVIIKLGSRGAYVRRSDFQGIIPGFAVEAIDTTGAGDAFCGALLTALANGQNPLQAVRFANAVGACCVQAVGPCDGVRTYKETLEFIETQEQASNLEE